MPRTAGRAQRDLLVSAGLAEPVHEVWNHQPLEEVVRCFGQRRYVVGTVREPSEWYLAMAVSAVQCHPLWFGPYLRATGTSGLRFGSKGQVLDWDGWSAACPWAEVIRAMVAPHDYAVEPVSVAEPDSHILRAPNGASLYAANYRRAFTIDGSLALTHVVMMDQVADAMLELQLELGSEPVPMPRYRETIGRVDVEQVYRGPAGQEALDLIGRLDGPLYERWARSGYALVEVT